MYIMKFISPTWAATQKIYNINKNNKMTILILIILILMIVMIGIGAVSGSRVLYPNFLLDS